MSNIFRIKLFNIVSMVDNKPIKKFKAKNLSLSMWENKVENGNSMFNFSFQKSYKDAQDNWQHTQNLQLQDLPLLQSLLNRAYTQEIVKEEEVI